jgi:hypothetical protein
MPANFWHLRREYSSEAVVVTEVHADIVRAGSVAEAHLADALEGVAHNIPKALAAAPVFTTALRCALSLAQPDLIRSNRGLTRTTKQFARATDNVRLMRKLSEQLLGPNLRTHARRLNTRAAE